MLNEKKSGTIASTAGPGTSRRKTTGGTSGRGIATPEGKCGHCTRSICCNSINQRIDTPRSMRDFDHLLWQISHANINLFKDCDGWFLNVLAPCEHLLPNGGCGIYERRPFVCREYSNDFCEYDEPIAKGAELFFSSYKSFDDYCRQRFRTWDRRWEVAR